MKINTSELEGAALDWSVAEAVKLKASVIPHGGYSNASTDYKIKYTCYRIWLDDELDIEYQPSTDWSQGGPLIESEQIELKWIGVDGVACGWNAWHQDITDMQCANTPLVAAMRAIVAAKLGAVVDVPDELIPTNGTIHT
jgi:hypothetical protein